MLSRIHDVRVGFCLMWLGLAFVGCSNSSTTPNTTNTPFMVVNTPSAARTYTEIEMTMIAYAKTPTVTASGPLVPAAEGDLATAVNGAAKSSTSFDIVTFDQNYYGDGQIVFHRKDGKVGGAIQIFFNQYPRQKGVRKKVG